MQLKAENANMRGGSSPSYCETAVVDKDTGKKVGIVHHERSPIVRYVSLFGGKYRGKFETFEECQAFIKGVEVVFNHMTDTTEEKTKASKVA